MHRFDSLRPRRARRLRIALGARLLDRTHRIQGRPGTRDRREAPGGRRLPRRSGAAQRRPHRSVRRRGRRRPPAGRGPRGSRSGRPAPRHRAGADDRRLPEPPEPGDAAGREIHAVPEGGRARRDRRRARAQPDVGSARAARSSRGRRRASCARARWRRAPAIGRSASRSSSWPNAIPYEMRPGDTLPVRLTYQQVPLAGALVVAYNQRTPYHKLSVRSDRDGRAAFMHRRTGRVAGEGGAHGAGARGLERRLGELLGVADVRDRSVSSRRGRKQLRLHYLGR